jgi:hypothetical protein
MLSYNYQSLPVLIERKTVADPELVKTRTLMQREGDEGLSATE